MLPRAVRSRAATARHFRRNPECCLNPPASRRVRLQDGRKADARGLFASTSAPGNSPRPASTRRRECNLSSTTQGDRRGMHFQVPPAAGQNSYAAPAGQLDALDRRTDSASTQPFGRELRGNRAHLRPEMSHTGTRPDRGGRRELPGEPRHAGCEGGGYGHGRPALGIRWQVAGDRDLGQDRAGRCGMRGRGGGGEVSSSTGAAARRERGRRKVRHGRRRFMAEGSQTRSSFRPAADGGDRQQDAGGPRRATPRRAWRRAGAGAPQHRRGRRRARAAGNHSDQSPLRRRGIDAILE